METFHENIMFRLILALYIVAYNFNVTVTLVNDQGILYAYYCL